MIPLLLIPPFPISSLSLSHVVKQFTEPEEADHQPFHLVIPSLPGLGFSDALPTNSAVISSTADILDSLMKRLGYSFYLATNAGAGISSPGQIDYKLADWLATQHADSCLGTHLISPPLTQPRPKDALLGWAKWSIAKLFKAPIWGYRAEDLSALKQSSKAAATTARSGRANAQDPGLTEPNTLSYALCDSPTGLLVIVMKGLRRLAPKREFTPTEIVNFTQLAWLPGPESAMRFWAYCQRHPEKPAAGAKSAGKPRVALTVFLGGERGPSRGDGDGDGDADASGNAEPGDADVFEGMKPPYSCPAWARTRYEVLYTNRASGDAGLLAWERPELIAAGVRGLAAAVLKADKRLKLSGQPEPQLPGQVVTSAETVVAPEEEAERPSSPALSDPGLLAPPTIGERLLPIREVSDDTKVASDESLIKDKSPSPIPTVPSPAGSGPPPSATA